MSTRVAPLAPRLQRLAPPAHNHRIRARSSLLPLLLLFGLLKLLLQSALTLLSVHAGYGIHRDELYYLLCGDRLALGYVDQPPLVALQARAAELLFGYHHLVLFRLLPAFAGALTLMLTGLLATAMGGTRRAAALAMLFVLTVPVFLATQGMLSMNAWEPVFWMSMVLAMLHLHAAPGATRWWVLLGLSAGLGVENKVSIVFFIGALLLAWLATPERRLLRTPGFGLAVGITVLLALPNLYWQWAHGFPTWEWLRDVQHSDKDTVLTLAEVLKEQVLMLSPFNLFVWLPGAAWLLLAPTARPWRAAGWLYVFFLVIMITLHAKDYYIAPIYPLLFSAGAVFWTRYAAGSRVRTATLVGYAALATFAVCLTAPLAVPVLSPPQFIRYRQVLGVAPVESEQHPGTTFPEFFGDHLGWEDLAGAVARVYRALPPQEQKQTGIIAGNYGQASALNVLGRPLGLPVTISGHQNYWLWGPHGYSGREMIVVTSQPLDAVGSLYRSCAVMDRQTSPYTMPWEQRWIFLCRDRVEPYATSWDALKLYR